MDDAALLREALDRAPCSTRQLALEAGVSPTLLTLIQQGKRNMTAETRGALHEALREWAGRCNSAAELLSPEPGGDGA